MTETDWATGFLDTVGALSGELLTRLRALAERPPTGQAAIDSLTALERRYTFGPQYLRPGQAIVDTSLLLSTDPIRGILLDGLDRLHDEVTRALAAGLNDAADPLYLRSDLLGLSVIGGGGRFAGYWFARVESWRPPVPPSSQTGWVAVHPGLSADHPLRAITPYRLADGTPVLLVRAAHATPWRFVRHSTIERLTALGREYQAETARAAAKEEAIAAEQARRVAAAAALEEQARRLRRGEDVRP